jgi:hypothetical protein
MNENDDEAEFARAMGSDEHFLSLGNSDPVFDVAIFE